MMMGCSSPSLVEVRRAHRLRVLGAELEDVADLDHALALERALALGARVAGAGFAEVREADAGRRGGGEVGGRDAAEVVVGLVGAGDVDAPAQDLVGDHRQRRRHGPDEAGLRALRRQHLLGRRQAELADELAQLGLAELVVAAHEDHERPAAAGAGGVGALPSVITTSDFMKARAGRPRKASTCVDRAHVRGVDLAGGRQRAAASAALAAPLSPAASSSPATASSTLAA